MGRGRVHLLRSETLTPLNNGPLCPHSLSVCEIIHSARMRKLSALLFVMLLCSLQLVSSGPDAVNPLICCLGVSQMKLPIKRIVSYSRTDSRCPIKAVIFKMIRGKQFCMDPAFDQVNAYMKAVDQRNYTSAPGNPTSSTH
ncbi:monocyte chemotactic protein 1B-like [Brachyhypopomus gauderio]|uniref:monocyte chemotactic protein 1B-like n=1 Tax=Brachyhypopomus gauderio TaxID=698409 RepID=UPI0040436EEC